MPKLASESRYLGESSSDHPVALLVRSIGEAVASKGSMEEFRTYVTNTAQSLVNYSVSEPETFTVLRWFRRSVLDLPRQDRRSWLAPLWKALASGFAPPEAQKEALATGLLRWVPDVGSALDLLSQEVLADWRGSTAGEIDAILALRMRIANAAVRRISEPWGELA